MDSYVYIVVADETAGLVTYDLASGWTLLYDADSNGTGYAIYYQAVSADTETLGIIADNTVYYDAALTNADMLDENGNLIEGITLSFTAYAIQQASFDDASDAYEALKLTILGDYGWTVVDEVSDLTEDHIIAEGNYILAADVEASSYLSTSSGTEVEIDLNGYTIDLNGSKYIITNGDLTLDDTAGGGTITGATGSTSAIRVSSMGSLTMNGGTITGNSCTGNGGAVYVDGGTFILNDGTISGNSVGSSKYGGGVVAYGSAEIIMNGGTISGNSAKYGGGVALYSTASATFTMNGGTITENEATTYGGGVWVGSDSTFILNGGTVTGNTAGTRGGDLYNKGTFENNGGTIKDTYGT